ncbi:MAG: hypothetical protein H6Q74_741 [Firmicutes bacterium]|nr:hypothetical protein [Bacillota bacterium]
MDYFISNRLGRTIILKLHEGDLVLESIKTLCEKEKIKTAVVTSGIGTLDQGRVHRISTIGNPPVQVTDTMDQTPLEVASISGIIANGDLHIHTVFGAPGQTWAGHLMEQCRTLFFGEIVIQELLGVDLERRKNEKGAPELFTKGL